MSTSIEDLKQLKAEYDKKLSEVGQSILKDAFGKIWETYPEVKRVRWDQYTPYFNDGEECVFSVNSDYPVIDFGKEGAGEDGDGFEYVSYKDTRQPTLRFVATVLRSVPSDIMKAIFGDHAQITADHNGFTVEKYDHE